MARRRVDTKFVIILAGVLTLAAGSVAGFYLYFRSLNSNPQHLKSRGDEALKKGDYNAAMGSYFSAAGKSTDPKERAALFELYGNIGADHTDGTGGARNYKRALTGWAYAIQFDGTREVAGERLMGEIFSIVRLVRDSAMQSPFDTNLSAAPDAPDQNLKIFRIFGVASNEIVNKRGNTPGESCKARASKAWFSMLSLMLQGKWEKADPAELEKIRVDIAKAIEANPDDAAGHLVNFYFEAGRADLIPLDKLVERKAKYEAELNKLDKYCTAHPDDVDTLVDMLAARVRLGLDPSKNPEYIKRAKEAWARQIGADGKGKTSPRLAEFLKQAAVTERKDDEAEKYLQRAMDDNPGHCLAIWRLARFLESRNRWPQSIELMEQIRSKAATGKGMDSLLNEELSRIVLEELPRIQLLLAMREGPSNPNGKAALDGAQSNLKILRGINPQDVWVKILEGRMDFILGNTTQAIETLKKANDIVGNSKSGDSPMRLWLRNFRAVKLYLADAYAARKDPQQAIDRYQEYFEELGRLGQPDDPHARLMRANILLSMNEFERAARDYDILNRELGNEPTVIRNWAAALIGLKRFKEAEDKIRLIDQKDVILLLRADAAMQDAKFAEALANVDEVLKLDEKHFEGRYLKARALYSMARGEEAAPILEKLLAERPDRMDIRRLYLVITMPNSTEDEIERMMIESVSDPFRKQLAWASYHWMQGRLSDALPAINEAEKLKPESPEVIDLKFHCLLGLRNYTEAAKYVGIAGQYNVDQVQGMLFKGQLEMAQANTLEKRNMALSTLKNAARDARDYHVAHSVLADAYYGMDMKEEALKEYQEAVRLKSDSLREIKIIIQILLSKPTEVTKAQAIDYLRKGLQIRPNDPILRLFEDQLGNQAEIIARREAQYARFPDDTQNMQRLSVLYLKRSMAAGPNVKQQDKDKDKAMAVELAEKVMAKAPKNLQVADWVAQMYRNAGMTQKALAVYLPFTTSDNLILRDAARLLQARMYRSMMMMPEAESIYRELIKSPAQATTAPAGTLESGIPASRQAARELADMLFDMEQPKQAEEAYKYVESVEGPTTKVTLRMCEAMLNQQKYEEADKRLADLMKSEPDNLEAMALSGLSLILQKRLNEASDRFADVLKRDPDNLNALHYRAFAQFSMQANLKQAIEDLSRVKKILADRGLTGVNGKVESRILLARIYRLLRRYAEAIGEYGDVVELDAPPGTASPSPMLTAVRAEYTDYLAELADQTRQITEDPRGVPQLQMLKGIGAADKLAEALTKLMAAPPKLPLWPQRYARLAVSEGRASTAIPVLKAAAADWPTNVEVVGSYLTVLVRAKRWDEAVALTDSMIKQWPNVSEIYGMRAAAEFGKNPSAPEVRASVEKSLELVGDTGVATFFRVTQLTQDTSEKIVKDVLEGLLAKYPNSVVPRLGLTALHIQKKRMEDVVTVLKPALDNPMLNDPKFQADKIMTLRMLGDANFNLNKFDEALEYYKQILAVNPDDMEALKNKAYILAENKNKPGDAIEPADKALKILQSRPPITVYNSIGNVMDSYGWILFLNAKEQKDPKVQAEGYAKAKDMLEKARDTELLALTLYHLACAYEKVENLPDAKRTVEQGLNLVRVRPDDAAKKKLEELQTKLKRL